VAGLLAEQKKLAALGFLPAASVDGREGPQTQTAVLAFQKWEGLDREGVIGPQTRSRLATARRPEPITRGASGKRAEVLLDRQVALAIDDNRVVRVVPVSTGKSATPTPPGDFTIYARIAKWWSVPFRDCSCGRCRSTAESPSTSSPRCPRTRRRTAACGSSRRPRGGCTTSRSSGCR
jgi:putative peptidoglycan binding protein/L,D-transpeptidase-like protein